MKSVVAPKGISWKVPPTRLSLLLSFSLCRDRPVQAFSFLVYPDTVSLGVSACRLITHTDLSEIILVFPICKCTFITCLWETRETYDSLRQRDVRMKAYPQCISLIIYLSCSSLFSFTLRGTFTVAFVMPFSYVMPTLNTIRFITS